jgi:hypothetical protein
MPLLERLLWLALLHRPLQAPGPFCTQFVRFVHFPEHRHFISLRCTKFYVRNKGASVARVVAYARVSTNGQTLDAQVGALEAAAATMIFQETRAGARTDTICRLTNTALCTQ